MLLNDEQKIYKSASAAVTSKKETLDKKKDLFFMQHRLKNQTEYKPAS